MSSAPRHDIIEPGDLSALVCIDRTEIRQSAVDQLASLDYKIHVGEGLEEIVLALRAHPYDVILIDDEFGGAAPRANPVADAATGLPIAQRRRQFIALLGRAFVTSDEMMAFILSVDLVINTGDVATLKHVLRRAVARQREFYRHYLECIRKAHAFTV